MVAMELMAEGTPPGLRCRHSVHTRKIWGMHAMPLIGSDAGEWNGRIAGFIVVAPEDAGDASMRLLSILVVTWRKRGAILWATHPDDVPAISPDPDYVSARPFMPQPPLS